MPGLFYRYLSINCLIYKALSKLLPRNAIAPPHHPITPCLRGQPLNPRTTVDRSTITPVERIHTVQLRGPAGDTVLTQALADRGVGCLQAHGQLPGRGVAFIQLLQQRLFKGLHGSFQADDFPAFGLLSA